LGIPPDIPRDVALGWTPGAFAGTHVVYFGTSLKDVDAAGRNVLKNKDLDQYFIHSIGHGVGLSVHEEPTLSPGSRDILKPGMVITIEPAVYIPGWGGMRVEDTYLVTKTGLENLTR
jgi:Xaa-Pro aminopeptidase